MRATYLGVLALGLLPSTAAAAQPNTPANQTGDRAAVRQAATPNSGRRPAAPQITTAKTTTPFPSTRADYNPANGDVVISNGTQTDSQTVATDSGGNLVGMVSTSRYKSDTASGYNAAQPTQQQSYAVSSNNVDAFAIVRSPRTDASYLISGQLATQALTPQGSGAKGSLRVVAANGSVTNMATGETVSKDYYSARCGGQPCT